MKKITFVIFAFLTSLCSFAQLALEDFEGTWTTGQGPTGWSIINVAGPAQTWQQANNTAAQPAYQGVHAAFLNKENVATGTQSEDWLITPQFTVPTNGQLHFFSRLTVNGDQGTAYKLMIGTDPTNTATFTQVTNWTELTLNTVQQEYEEKIIDLPAANYGQQRYLAFVMMGDDGDRWLIDNVSVMQLCSPPTNLTASNATTTSSQLSWTDASGAGSWEIEVVAPGNTPTGSGVVYTGTLPYTATGLTATTTYTYYVRSLCSPSGNNSTWAGPFTFSTLTCELSQQCTYVFNLTDSFGDGWNGNTMTVAQNGITMATLSLASGSASTVNVPLCDGIPFTLYWNSGGTWAAEVGVSVSNNFGQIIYTKAAGSGTQNSLLYTGTVDCDTPLCLPPSGLTATNITETTASLGWGSATTGNWEYYLVTAGSAAPTASSTGVVTTTQPVTVTGLTASTGYSYYVRIICDGGTTSTWAGPYSFTTTQIPAQLNFTENFEGGLSWTLLNGTQTNKWFYGTATSNSPTHSLYITNDAGVSNAYTNNSTSIVHAYRDIAIPAGATDVSFSFDWKNLGETGWDFIRVYAVPTNFVFTPGTMIGTLPTNGIQLGANFVGNSNWTTYSQIFNASAYANGTMRLIFQWRNDGSGGSNPPGAIDNINLTLITCPQPLNVLVSNITAGEATVAWTNQGTATSWEVIVQPATDAAPTASSVGTVVTTNPYTVTGLTSGTLYKAYVRAICSDTDKSLWTASANFNTTICDPAQQCSYSFILTDSFGDGWNGNTMSVMQNGIVVGTLNLASGAGPVTVTVPLCDGIPFTLFWNSGGSWATEVGVSVQNNFAQTLYTHAPGTSLQNTLLYTGNVDCDTPECLPPSGLYATTLTYSATVGWGGSATGNWEVYYTGAGNAAPGDTETNVITTTENPVTIEGLNASTQYDFYVRVICENGTSSWAGPYTFETLPLCPDPTNIEIHCLDSTSATFTWQAGAGETSWEVAVVTASSPVPTTGTVVTEPVYYVENLSVSTQYTFYVRAVCELVDGYSSWVELDFTTPVVSAGQAQALCAGILAVPQSSNYGGTVPAYGQVGCLYSTPNPTWYYVTLGGTGEVVLNLTQVNTNGTPIDVDFAAFGPFDSLGEACYQIGSPPNTSYIVDCSYSASATETINVTGNPGDVFALLVTNFNGSQGTTTITQTSGPDVSCVPTVELGPNLVLCDTDSHNITATVNNPGDPQVYTYTWSMDGVEFTPTVVTTTSDSQTITVTEEGSHVYTVVVSMPIPVSPDPVTDTVTIAISHPFTAPVFDAVTVCGDGTSSQADLSGVNPLGTLDSTMYGGAIYASQSNANTGTNPIDTSVPFTVTGSGQTLYIAVWDLAVPTCKKVATLQINVTNAATATVTYTPAELCTTSDPVTPAVVGSTGGVFSATPEGLAIDAATGTVTPAESTAGVYQVIYTIAATATCPEFVSEPVTVTIFEPLSGSVTYSGPYCNTAGVADPTIDAGIAGGTFAGDSGLVIDPTTGQIDLTLSTVGEHTVTYTPPASGPCSGAPITITVVINEAYSATITYGTAPFCTDGGVATPVLTGDSNGVYQVTPAEGLVIDPVTGEITLAESTPGTYEIVYFIAANDSCSDFTSLPATVVIEPAQVATEFTYSGPYCSNDGTATVTITTEGTPDGVFTATPAGLAINASTGEVDLAASAYGTYQVVYTTPGSTACAPVVSSPVEIVINELPTASIAYSASQFCSDAGIATVQLTSTGPGATAGTYTSTPEGVVFVAGTGDIDLAASTPGTYDITYTIAAAGGCDAVVATATGIMITAKPSAEFGYSYPTVCDNAGTMSPVAVDAGTLGTFTVDVAGLNIDSATGVITPAGSTPGTYVVTNTVTAFAGCEGTYTFTVVITPAPVAEFTYSAPAYCVAGDDIPEPALAGDAGTFTATPAGLAIDAATGIIDLDNSTPGTYTVINTITGTDDCPTVVSNPVTVTVTALPVIAYTEGCDGTQYTLAVVLTDDPVYGVDDVTITWQSGSVNGPVIGTDETVVITEGGTYYVTITPETGAACPVTQEIVVANTICEVQRGISPNNDGLNDTFDLTGYGVTKLEIFNRYGKEVFSFNGAYTNQWNGKTSGGEELPTGTYFYMLHRNTGENKTGWVYINREVK
ncbi:fibronectin type III domain-containing protein [Flavobacterium sp. RHBU_3]|uniref:fibronectin type III domain-containing protein n=1 Tax=Flavobacterium sp. RHBU_3 TaxID=3391184 RepID=UPI003985180E